MAAQPGDNKVKLEAMISTETTSGREFAVVVVVTAPAALGTEQSDSAGARGVDLVAVLDASGGMSEDNRLDRMKEAMYSVLDKLGPDDRLCILSFNDEVRRLTELEFMSEENWANANARVGELTAGGGANVKAATEAAATVLAQRGEDEQRDRVGRVIFLSNGDDQEDDAVADTAGSSEKDAKKASPDLAPDAFVLGADNKLSPLSFSAGDTSAAYSYVKDSVDKIQDAPDLISVETALSVQIDLHAQEGVTVLSIMSGGHPVALGPDGPRSLTIYIQDLYAGEHKSFTVYLTVPEGKEDLLAVTGWYRHPATGEDTQLDVLEVFVPRPPTPAVIFLWLSGMVMHLLSWAWDSVAKQGNIFKKPEVRNKLGKVRKVWAWVRNNPYPCALALLLLGAAMLRLMPKEAKEDGKSSGQQHPGWPWVEEPFDFVTLMAMERSGITSCFNRALDADMCPAMNRYVYQAIVHGTGFHGAPGEKEQLHARLDQEYFYQHGEE